RATRGCSRPVAETPCWLFSATASRSPGPTTGPRRRRSRTATGSSSSTGRSESAATITAPTQTTSRGSPGPPPRSATGAPHDPARRLPAVDAALNATSALLLTVGFVAIRRRRVALHRACMVAAFTTSVAFLVCYLTYHAHVGTTRFSGEGWVRPV